MELRRDHLWGIDDPLFPSTAIGQDSDRRFAATGLARTHWASAAAVQKIFKHSFEAIGLHGFNLSIGIEVGPLIGIEKGPL